MARRWLGAVSLALLLIASGCGEDTAVVEGEAVVDAEGLDSALDSAASGSDSAAGTDDAVTADTTTDAATDAAAGSDGAGSDGQGADSADADAADGDASQPACPGAGGCACKAHAECASGHCGTNAAGAAVCSETCPETAACDDGDACTGPDGCKGGKCNGGPVTCDDSNPCTTDSCDKKQGCQTTPAAGSCDDGNLCTSGDACKDGKCAASDTNCDDGNPCTDDTCAPKTGCAHSPNAVQCSDGNGCSLGDACDAGACAGGKTKSCDDANPCTIDSCAPETGACAHLPADVTCSDGNLCTEADTCASGQCAGKPANCDDGNACTTDSCDPKTGCGYLDNTGKCDDGNGCTDFDKCSGGKCKGTAKDAADCDDQNPCTQDGCDKATGLCSHAPTTGACDDGNSCTSNDTCDAGSCKGGANTCPCQADADCPSDNNACNGTAFCDKAKFPYVCKIKPGSVVECDPVKDGTCAANQCDVVTGQCAMAAIAEGKPCDADGTACTADDACAAGKCIAGKGLACDDNNACTTDSCDSKIGCKYLANAALCDADGNACTVGDACQDKVCVTGKLKSCDDNNACTSDSCDLKTGACVFDGAAVEGDPCDADGSACTVGDACKAGACAKGQALSCDDKNPCTADGCNPKTGCVSSATVGPCDADSSACTVADQCDGKLCLPGAKKNCDDGDGCTTDSCDPKTGDCSHAVIVGCGGNCLQDKDCDDVNVCTQDSCTAGKCAVKAAAGSCDDGSKCTTADACDAGKCTGKAIDCDDANACTNDGCDAKAGCTHANNTDPCDDGDFCTSGDACSAGKCSAGKPKICDDGDDCTKDSCNPADGGCKFNGIAGCGIYCVKASDCDDKNVCTTESCQGGKCVSVTNSLNCDDADPCTLTDLCLGGKCAPGVAKNCNDANPCTQDSCDGKTGACVNLGLPATATCDDSNACTTDDACGGTGPTGKPTCVGKAKNCDDANACTTDSCNAGNAGCLNTANSGACEDGNPCSVGDSCASGKCVAGNQVWLDSLAGSIAGYADGEAAKAKFQYPYGVAVDGAGVTYVADSANHRIRKIAADGTVTTLAGGAAPGFQDGKGATALFNQPYAVAVDGAGNVYVADTYNHAIRKVTPGGDVTSIAGAGLSGAVDGTGSAARFSYPHGLAIGSGGAIFVADSYNHRIRVIVGTSVTTLAGSAAGFKDGSGAAAAFNYPLGIAVAADGAIYVADQSNHRVRTVTPLGKVDTLAGSGVQGMLDGDASVARFSNPWGIALAADGAILVADRYNHRIRRVAGGKVSTLAGNSQAGLTDGVALQGRLYYPANLAVDSSGYVYIADGHNMRIRRIRDASAWCQLGSQCFVTGATNPQNSCQACDPAKSSSNWTTLADAAVCSDGNLCTGSDTCSSGTCGGSATTCDDKDDCTKDSCSAATGLCVSAPIVGCGGNCSQASDCDDKNPCTDDNCSGGSAGAGKCKNGPNTAACDDGNVCTLGDTCSGGSCVAGAAVETTTVAGGAVGNADGKGANAKFNRPAGIDVDAKGNLYLADYSNHNIRKIAPDGTVTTIAGAGTPGYADGKGNQALFYTPTDVKVAADGTLYVADVNNHRIRAIDVDGNVTTVAGSVGGYLDGVANAARFNAPYGIALAPSGAIYVADFGNHRVRRILKGQVSTVAGSTQGWADGTGSAAKLNTPLGIALLGDGSLVVSEQLGHRLRLVTPNGKVTTLAGTGSAGYQEGQASTALFNQPWGVAADRSGNVFVVDRGNQRIRKLTPGGVIARLTGSGLAGYLDGYANVTRFGSPLGIAVDERGAVYVADFDNARIRKVVDGTKPCLVGSACYSGGTTNPGNACEQCDAAKNAKGFTAKGEGAACYDDKLCTAGDQCTSGNCGGAEAVCDDSQACTTDSCDAATGACQFEPILGCDGYCTQNSQCDDKNPCTTDTCQGNKCSFLNNSAPCDDGNSCTLGDTCKGGKCEVGMDTMVTTLAGSGVAGYNDATGTAASFNAPLGVELSASGVSYVADTSNHRIRKIDAKGQVTTLAGSGKPGFFDATGALAWFNAPADLALDASGTLYVADRDNHSIRKVAADGAVSTLAGGGAAGWLDDVGGKARFNTPYGLAVTPGGVVYVADYGNHRIRKILPNGKVTTLAGNGSGGYKDATGGAAQFYYPTGLALDPAGNVLVADYYNHRIRKVTPSGVVTTVAGTGIGGLKDGDVSLANFYYPWDVAVDSTGAIFVSDRYNHRIRKIVANLVITVAGIGAGFQDGNSSVARLIYPTSITLDARGNLAIADSSNQRIRLLRETALACQIGGVCYSHSLDNPANSCQKCDGLKTQSQWTAKGDAAQCQDGAYCTAADSCAGGTCSAGSGACDDGNACTADSCEAATGGCSYSAIPGCPN